MRGAQMLRWLKAILDWGKRRHGTDPPTWPFDPESSVRVPRRYGPTGRSASVAVAEPADVDRIMAIGGRTGDRPVLGRRSSDEG